MTPTLLSVSFLGLTLIRKKERKTEKKRGRREFSLETRTDLRKSVFTHIVTQFHLLLEMHGVKFEPLLLLLQYNLQGNLRVYYFRQHG